MGIFDFFKGSKDKDSSGLYQEEQSINIKWKNLIDKIQTSQQSGNITIIQKTMLELKENYGVQTLFYLIFHGRFKDKRLFLPLPFDYKNETIDAAKRYQTGFKVNDPMLSVALENYKPEYQVQTNGKVGRKPNLVVDQAIVSVSSVLKGKSLSGINEISQAAFDTIFHFSKIPIASFFFSIPMLVASSSNNAQPNIGQLEASILLGTENLLIELYDNINEGGNITETLLTNKIKSFFDYSNQESLNKKITNDEDSGFIIDAFRPIKIFYDRFTLMEEVTPFGTMKYYFMAVKNKADGFRVRKNKFPSIESIPQYTYYEARTPENYIIGRDKMGDYEK